MSEIKKNQLFSIGEELSFKDFISILKIGFNFIKSKWLVICIAGFIGGAAGVTYAVLHKTSYTADLTFALEDERSGGGGLSGALGLASSLGFDMGNSAGGAFSGSNLFELMKSRNLIEKSLLSSIQVSGKKITLVDYYIQFTKLNETLSNVKGLENVHYKENEDRSNFTLQKDSLLGEIYYSIINGMLNVSQRDKKISIISVEVKSENELFSKALCESVVKEVSDYYIVSKSKKARNNVAILQKQADSVRSALNEAISGVAQANDLTFNLNPALNIKKTSSTKRQVDVQANTAILTQLIINLEMARVTLLKETPLIQIIDRPIFPLKKEKIGKRKSFIYGSFITSFILIFSLLIHKAYKNLITQ